MGHEIYDGVELFGIEELEKQFAKTLKKFPDEATALLKTQGEILKKEVVKNTPVLKSKRSDRKPGQLKKSWRLLTPKVYKTSSGDVTVVRVQSTAPHAHLVEDGHEIVTRERTRSNGRYAKEAVKLGKTSKLKAGGKKAFGIKSGGRAKGKNMLKNAQKKVQNSFFREAERMLENLTKDYE